MGRWLRSKDPRFLPLELLMYGGVAFVGATRIEQPRSPGARAWSIDVGF